MYQLVAPCQPKPAFLVAAIACLLLTSAPSGGRTITKWTPHYIVKTDINEQFAGEVAELMEHIYKEYSRRFSSFTRRRKDRFEVLVYKHQKDYCADVGQGFGNTGGMFIANRNLLISFLGDRDRDVVMTTLKHEGFHQFAWEYLGDRLPVWANEGIAQLFEYAVFNGKQFRTGGVPGDTVNALQSAYDEERALSLQALIQMSHDQWGTHLNRDAGEGEVQYAQAWALIHFLVYGENGRYQKRMAGYLKLLDRGVANTRAFAQAFGKDMKTFEFKWRRHIDDLRTSPFFRCRNQMRFLGYAMRLLRTELGAGYSFEKFRHEVAEPRHVWSWGPPGKMQPLKVADALFACPCREHPLKDKTYTLKWPPGARMPQLECRQCPGHKLTLSFYIDDETGDYRLQLSDFLHAGAGPSSGRGRRSFDRNQDNQ